MVYLVGKSYFKIIEGKEIPVLTTEDPMEAMQAASKYNKGKKEFKWLLFIKNNNQSITK